MITIERRAFTKALALAGSVIERRTTIPVLAGVKVTANGALRFEGSDLDTTTETEIEYEGEALDSFTLLDPARIRAAVNAAGGDKVTLGKAETKAQITSGALNASLATLPGDDHPGSDKIADQRFSAELGADALKALRRVRAAISTEETRYYLNGICVRKIGDWLYRFAATDGHRLMVVDVPLPNAEGELPDNAIIPRRFLDTAFQHFAKAPEGVRLTYGGKRLDNVPDKTLAPEAVAAPRIGLSGRIGPVALAISSKLIDGTYPDYSRVIPASSPHSVSVNRSALVQAVRSLSPFGDGRIRAIKITGRKGALRVELNSPTVGSAHFDVPAEHKLPAGFEIGFNGQYLLDTLDALRGDEVAIGLTDPGAPAVYKDPADSTFLAVLMPMRV